jgi:uncharacterized protein YmfQ (DUF2313 family)
VVAGLAPTYGRVDRAAQELLVDAFPATVGPLLPEWESSLGLPDPCTGQLPSSEQRRARVLARFVASGGQSAAYFVGYAAALGYRVTVTNFAPFRCGASACGHPLGGPAWAHTWRITAPITTITPFRCGASAAGDPLASWGNALLECELSPLAPAHGIVQFAYE